MGSKDEDAMSKKDRLFSKLAQEWIGKTWLGWWKIDVVFYDNKEYAKVEGYKKKHARCSAATCHTNWQYLDATINVNLSVIKTMGKEQLEYVVVHELMHAFLNEMRAGGVEHEERVATILAKSFMLCDSHSKKTL